MISNIGNVNFRKCTITFIVIGLLFSFCPVETEAFSEQVIQRGATGDDVIELQARLQYVGYYTGKIDGVYGWGTYWAVRNYQNDYGIMVDGLVGTEMKNKLEETTIFDKKHVYAKIYAGKDFDTFGKTGKGPQPGWPPPGQRDPGNRWTPKAQGHVGPPVQPGTPPADPRVQPRTPPADPRVQPRTPPADPRVQPRTPPAEPGVQPETPPAEPGVQPETPAPPEQEATPEQEAPQEVAQAEQAINLPDGFTANDLKLMANAVYGEARGEPYEGQVAVAAVILNRVKNSNFPNTVSGVIFEPLAFTAVADGQIWLEPNESAKRAVNDAINGWDPTGGLVYYFNPDTATSAWMHARPRVKRIGKHVFCR